MPTADLPPLRIGVLALQGSFAEHLTLLASLSSPSLPLEPLAVRTPAQLALCHALIIPGGESTAISLLIQKSGLLEPLREFVRRAKAGEGRSVWGTCAGMILLAEEVVGGRIAGARRDEGPGVEGSAEKEKGWGGLGGVEVRVVRNQFGRQAESFSHPLPLPFLSTPFPAIFIRAPVIHSLLPPPASPSASTPSPPLEVLARLPAERVPKELPGQAEVGPDAGVVMVRQGGLVMSSFHPELTGDGRVHEWWVREVVGGAVAGSRG